MTFALDQILEKYVTDKEVLQKLTSYFSRHELIGEEIFPYISKGQKDPLSRYDEFSYRPVTKEVFIKRIPFYFYKPENDRNVGNLYLYLTGLFRNYSDKQNYDSLLEELYCTLETMYYHHNIDLEILFEYPIEQTGQVSRTDVLYKWARYLEIAKKLSIQEKTPRHLLVDYNYALERAGLPPEIFELEEQSIAEYISRSGNILELRGTIPCDENGQPILRWIGAKIKNPVRVWAKVNKRMNGSLYVEACPTTTVWGLNCWGRNDDGSDTWYPLYIGPQLIEFDPQALKWIRKQAKLSQREVSDAIGASVRTYQKWESGDTAPDSHHLLRLMNVLNIRDTMELTKIIEPD